MLQMSEDIIDDENKDVMKKFRELFGNLSGFFGNNINLKDINPEDIIDKSFSISYRFEPGKDDPEIRIAGDVDQEAFSKFMQKIPKIATVRPERKEIELIPVWKMKESETKKEASSVLSVEPYSEVTEFDGFVEVCVEVPGVQEDDIYFRIDESGEELTIEANRDDKIFYKEIMLPGKFQTSDFKLALKNGIACLRVKRKLNE